MPWYNAVTGEQVYSPSDEDKQKDELVYKPSIYAKEELPTWSEVYEEFYLGKQYTYDPDNPDDQTIDPYWKIPHKKFLIAVVCNQFNKMIFEDGLKDEILSQLSNEFCTEVRGIQFICGNEIYKGTRVYYDNGLKVKSWDSPIDVYKLPMPNGKPNPFIISNNHRIDITKTEGVISIYPIIQLLDYDLGKVIHVPRVNDGHFNAIMDIMIKRFKEYFTGDIGWKDSEGKLIEGDPGCRSCTSAGYETT